MNLNVDTMDKIIKYFFYISIICCLIFVISVTIYKVHKEHNEKLIMVVEKRIEEATMKCYNEKNCDNKVSLKELYEMNYLSKEVHPVSEAYLSEDLYVVKNNNEYEITIN